MAAAMSLAPESVRAAQLLLSHIDAALTDLQPPNTVG